MHFDPSVLLEILDPETLEPVKPGEAGEVIVTVINPINTLLRFATGDLSSAVYDECPCGRKSPRLTGILGRVDQVIKVRGLFVHPGQLNEVMSQFTEVDRFRAVITRERAMDDLTVEVESSQGVEHRTAPIRVALADTQSTSTPTQTATPDPTTTTAICSSVSRIPMARSAMPYA